MSRETSQFVLAILTLAGGVVLVALGEREVGITLLTALGVGAVGVTGRQVVAARRADEG